MKKEYSYLQDSYYEDENSAAQRRAFLKKIDDFVNQKQYIRITLLNWREDPIKEISGELTGGTLTKDGSSAIRRTCSLSASLGRGEYDIEDLEFDFAINKKIFIEIGIKNYTNQYPEYPILWFPQGVFFISGVSISTSSTSVTNISLTLKDKMCRLNGEIGGTFPATTILDEVDTQDADGSYVSEKVLIYDIIQELVHHYGGEQLNNIVIEDVPLRIKKIMRWTGSTPLYMSPTATGYGSTSWYPSLEKPKSGEFYTITNGEDAGYIYSDFVYSDELVVEPGDSVCAALDKIKQMLGNYEYFYDVFGVFHFREIKNYLNTTQAKIVLDDMKKNDYLVEVTSEKSVYTFSDNCNLISLSINPNYGNIKNDYIVQGLRQMTSEDVSYPVRYHLAIDRKPTPGSEFKNLLLYKDSSGYIKAAFPQYTEELTPSINNFNLIYRTSEDRFFFFNGEKHEEISPYIDENKVQHWYPADGQRAYITKDWRTELYLRGLLVKNQSLDSGLYYTNMMDEHVSILDADITKIENDSSWLGTIARVIKNDVADAAFYFEELDAFWCQIYDIAAQKFYTKGLNKDDLNYISALTDGNYFLDFIDSSSAELGKYSVQNIGRRTNVTKNDEINCLFQPLIIDTVFINNDDENRQELIEECIAQGQDYCQVSPEIYWAFSIGGYKNGAFDQIKYDLYLHTNYQRTLSISAIPAFYLEPNVRVSVSEKNTNTYGDFVIQTISIPLGPGNQMSVSANECFERF